eukprot:CAMPEP_0197530036 /NCGR_PEP_ID=MMETSP1318-20131121/30430_1 /TAXON_ID=552666 /ORGANISM="Partenskyella glossopodia, Strain RCC365" /LENGTH=170 /DNA_ID=CAMNT_0043085701 /DNA_START=785 /DNA_END=1297 /DNA_ORIENTATION=-
MGMTTYEVILQNRLFSAGNEEKRKTAMVALEYHYPGSLERRLDMPNITSLCWMCKTAKVNPQDGKKIQNWQADPEASVSSHSRHHPNKQIQNPSSHSVTLNKGHATSPAEDSTPRTLPNSARALEPKSLELAQNSSVQSETPFSPSQLIGYNNPDPKATRVMMSPAIYDR